MKLISAKYQDETPGEFSPGVEIKVWVSLIPSYDFISKPEVQSVYGEAFVNNVLKPAIKSVLQERCAK